ncbi:MAG: carbamate kinase, partial [Alphaproteobacteria bacterium]
VVTQIEVDRNDPAFEDPSKPIGSYMDEAFAKQHAAEHDWHVRKEGDRGWRRVVASPRPISIVDIGAIEALIDANHIVIACGGGGIPVYTDSNGDLQGLEAVIDKDLASSLLAHELNAEFLVITTEVEKVALDFGTSKERWLDRMTVSEARAHQAEGQFPDGSMGPKIDAIVGFIEAGGGTGIVTNPQNLGCAMSGETGTWIVPDGD